MNIRQLVRIPAVVSLLAAVILPAYAQRQPQTFFKQQIHLSDAEIQKIDRGEVVTKVLESADKYGILVFGGVYVNAPIEKFAEVFRDVEKLQQEKVYLLVHQFGRIGAEPKLSDFDLLSFSNADIDDLEDCKPGDCDIQVMNVEAFHKLVNWKSKNRYAEVNKVLRQRFFEGMKQYMNGGLKAFGSYRDREKPFDIYREMKEMVDRSYYLPKDKAPEIYHHIIDYPQGKMKGVEDIFYWEKIDFGQGPTIRVNHVSLFPHGFGAAKLIAANEQLYASKYMRIALQMYYCVPDSASPGKPGFYLIQMNDSRMPDFGGIKGRIVRRIATGKAEEATHDTTEIFERRSEGK